ncbi:DUF418 domain-containing protein [Flammeovirga yaeyamensis]|uniref:DUF418 domain-containing protein n=1 Tax=Flammeovirga yaeyamensis TaxID=367791 RepID=A0AAX1N2W2_9BACT|nr:DUF418 domain-containing protein [Flammeovirga yaeyamensis]MBB3696075.1 uncharacterized protein [Flammeovirga yaeyamensis]NMF34760.1 DUF418 domain-containing protein [Flammeovirga yaeyamensis]QWG00412.1 DUF418 domain-containing protein [Flammeovirga yaeyamensis]
MKKTTPSTIGPTTGKMRLGVIDALRGFAILGILFANILSWSLFKFTPFSTLEQLPYHELNDTLYSLLSFFIDTKFYSIFSILFGVGFFLQYDRQRDNQEAFLKVYKRRLRFLILFGFIHMLFWSGDILMLYGMMAFVFIQFRNLPSNKILAWSIGLMAAPLLIDVIVMMIAPGWMTPEQSLAKKTYIDQDPASVVAAFESGNVLVALKQNLHNVMWRWFDFLPSGRPFKVLGLFLLGFYLQSKNFFTETGRSWKVVIGFFTVGAISHFIGYQIGGSMALFASTPSDLFFKAIMVFGQICLALSYASLLSIIYYTKWGETIFFPLTAVGKMSFTNYLSHTFIGIVIFYGVGFGLGGQLNLAPIFILAVFIYAFQVGYSYYWLKYFKFGPLEWGWKCLTYKKRFPIRNSTYEKIKAQKAKQALG